MKLIVINNISIRFFDSIAFIDISSVSLLPFDINKNVFAIKYLLPIFTGGHYFSNEVWIVAIANIIFECLCCCVDGFVYEICFGDCIGTFYTIFFWGEEGLLLEYVYLFH